MIIQIGVILNGATSIGGLEKSLICYQYLAICQISCQLFLTMCTRADGHDLSIRQSITLVHCVEMVQQVELIFGTR